LLRLGVGERDVIVLAQALQADLLVMADLEGREEAERPAFAVMGTLRVLELAAESGLLDLPIAIGTLQATSFYAPASLIREMLARDATRKEPS
jgi:predicted nucleic acid-binding protein